MFYRVVAVEITIFLLNWTIFRKKSVERNQKTTLIYKPHMVRNCTTASRFLLRGKIHLPKVKHPNFEGHMMLNEYNYQQEAKLSLG